MRLSLHAAALVAAALTLAACSGTGPAGPVAGPDDTPPEEGYPVYETFDPAGYDAEPPAQTTIVHDVPAHVMEGRVEVPAQAGPPAPPEPAEPTARQVDGYRIQVFNTASGDAAERIRGEAIDWWQSVQSTPDAPRTMEALVAYQQPYYRVRIGSFETREEADQALALVRQRFPDAFIVSDLVTVIE